MSITFEGQRSSDINLYVPLWNTSLRLTVGLWSISCPRQSKRGGTTSSSGQLWLQADPIHCLNSGAFSLYFWSRLLNAFLIDCDSDQWLAVAGLLSQSRIYSSFLPRSSMLPCLSGTEGGLSMNLSSHSSVYTLQPLPDPVNVLSVSSHTCTQNNYSVVKSCSKNLHHCLWIERKKYLLIADSFKSLSTVWKQYFII